MSIKSLLGVAIGCLFCYASPTQAQTPFPDLVSQVRRATVIVRAYDDRGNPTGQGIGLLINVDRVVTNRHVIQSSGNIRIETFNGRVIAVRKVVTNYPKSNFVTLKIDKSPHDVVSLRAVLISSGDGRAVIVTDTRLTFWKATADLAGVWNFEHVNTRLQIIASLNEATTGSTINLKAHVMGPTVSISKITRRQH